MASKATKLRRHGRRRAVKSVCRACKPKQPVSSLARSAVSA